MELKFIIIDTSRVPLKSHESSQLILGIICLVDQMQKLSSYKSRFIMTYM